MYVLLAGYPPFNGYNDIDITNNVKNGVYSLETKEFKRVSPNALSLLQACMEKDCEKRLSAGEVLSHEWFQDYQFTRKVEFWLF